MIEPTSCPAGPISRCHSPAKPRHKFCSHSLVVGRRWDAPDCKDEGIFLPELHVRDGAMERLLEILERQPTWLRALIWDTILFFLKEDDGQLNVR